MANLVGLVVARTHVAPYDVCDVGVDVSEHPRVIIAYGFDDEHLNDINTKS